MIRTRHSDVQSAISVSSRLSNLRLNKSLTNQTNNAGPYSARMDGYELVKVDTNHSLDSAYQEAQKYKIKLSLTKHEISLLRYTWNKMLMDEPLNMGDSQIPGGFGTHKIISTNSSIVASSLFCKQLYSNLLGMAPDLIKQFPSIHHQASAFAGVMSMTISQLENLETIDDYLCNLGKRHSRILNIQPAQFELLGEALVITFHERFGLKFTQEIEVLWIKLFMYLANSMIQFGIDPHARMSGVYEEPQDRESSVKSASSTESIMDNSIYSFYKRESIAHDSVITANTSVDNISLNSRNLKSRIKKRKRDCVIV